MKALVILLSCMMGINRVRSEQNATFGICKDRKLDSTNLISDRKVSSPVECAEQCMRDNTCNSANFIDSSQTCELYKEFSTQTQCDQLVSSEGTTVIIKIIMMYNPCKNNQPFDGVSCMCSSPLSGTFCEQGPRDCSDIDDKGYFDVYPSDGIGKIRVFCRWRYMIAFAAPQNGFTMEYHNKTWEEYKYGFGDMNQASAEAIDAYWMGNDNMHRITNGTLSYDLKLWFYHSTLQAYTHHKPFKVDSETENYTIHYSTMTDEPGNRMLDGASFSTVDRNDKTCAASYGVGYWFDNVCSKEPPLFGSYLQDGSIQNYTTFRAFLIRY